MCSIFHKRFLKALEHAARTQELVLQAILHKNSDTWFGRRHHFGAIHSVKEYQTAVPICTYIDFEEPIRRVAHGEVEILTREPIDYLQYTSGSTTGQQKLIPCTSTFRHVVWKSVLTSQGFLHQHALKQNMNIQPGLMLVGTHPSNYTEAGIPCGTPSARYALSSRKFWRTISIAPFEATHPAHVETRWYLHWYYALTQQSLSSISAPYVAPLLASAHFLFEQSNNLIQDIADGTLNAHLQISTTERAELVKRLRPNRERAAQLTRIIEQEGGLIPRIIWPNLGWLFSVHGPAFAPYQASLARSYAYQFIWGMPYLASEGIVGIPFAANGYSHLPAIQASFLEFIPEDEWTYAQPRTILVTDLQYGQKYDVVLTGWNGIYRYRLGDIIEVDGEFCGMPTIKIISRIKTVLSISWEKTTEEQVVQAVEASARECGIVFVDFVVDIDTGFVPARYCLWAEPANTTSLDKQRLQRVFDAHLRRVNPIYAIVRGNAEIGDPLVRLLPIGTFAQFYQYKQNQGMSADQMKILHSIPQWDYIRTQDL